jgi:hypothetical protein
MTQLLTWPFLTALEELRRLEDTATHGNQLERKIWLTLSRILALLPWQQAVNTSISPNDQKSIAKVKCL